MAEAIAAAAAVDGGDLCSGGGSGTHATAAALAYPPYTRPGLQIHFCRSPGDLCFRELCEGPSYAAMGAVQRRKGSNEQKCSDGSGDGKAAHPVLPGPELSSLEDRGAQVSSRR